MQADTKTTPFQRILEDIATKHGIPIATLNDWCADINKEKQTDEIMSKFFDDVTFNIQMVVQEKMALLAFQAFKTSQEKVASDHKIPEKILTSWCTNFEKKLPSIFQQHQYNVEKDKLDINTAIKRIYITYAFLSETLIESGVLPTWRGIPPNNLYHLSDDIVLDIAIRVQRDKARFSYFHNIKENSVDPFKVAGLFMYWIAKLKPISFNNHQTDPIRGHEFYLNEYLAIIFGVTRGDQKKGFQNIPKIVQEELRYNLRYRSYSSDDLILLLRTLLA